MLSSAERDFLQALNDLNVRFMLVGMSAALLLGARGSTEDMDLWFENIADPSIAEAARRAGGFWVTRSEPPMLGGMSDRLDVVTSMSGLAEFAKELEHSRELEVDGVRVRVLELDRIIASKRASNRPKDLAALPALELALSVLAKKA